MTSRYIRAPAGEGFWDFFPLLACGETSLLPGEGMTGKVSRHAEQQSTQGEAESKGEGVL